MKKYLPGTRFACLHQNVTKHLVREAAANVHDEKIRRAGGSESILIVYEILCP